MFHIFAFYALHILSLFAPASALEVADCSGSCIDARGSDDIQFIQKRLEVEYSLGKDSSMMNFSNPSAESKSIDKLLKWSDADSMPPSWLAHLQVNPVCAVLLLILGLCGRLVALLPTGSRRMRSAANTLQERAGLPQMAPSQRYAEEAAQAKFENWFDMIPKSNDPFISELGQNARPPLSYSLLHEFAFSKEVRLDRFGINLADRVCTMIPNGPEAAVCFLVFPLRCVFAPLNPILTKQELEFEFEDLPCHTLVVNTSTLAEGSANGVEVARQQNIQVLQLLPSLEVAGLFKLAHSLQSSHSNVFDLFGSKDAEVLAKRQHVALVLHTSGTTKKPKIVPLTHENLTVGALCIQSTLQRDAMQVCLNLMPLYHIHGLSVNILASAFSGSSVVCSSGYRSGVDSLSCLSQSGATWYSAVPTMHHGITEAAESAINNGEEVACKVGLARSCSAALAPVLALRLEEALSCVALPTYAMTESMPIASNALPPYQRDLSSVGFAAGPQFILRDSDGHEVPQGKEAEICVKGICVTQGYEFRDHMDEDPNLQGFHSDGWLRTGDKGYLNDSGFLCITGRFKEIINRGGEKISPLEIEGLFRRHNGVLDCLIFAAPHKQLGETVGLVLVPRPGSEFQHSPETLVMARAFASQEFSEKWAPECVVFMTQVPKGSTGKPARIGLAKRIALPVIDALDCETPRVWDASSGKVVALLNVESVRVDVSRQQRQETKIMQQSQDSLGLTVQNTPEHMQAMRTIYSLYGVGILLVISEHFQVWNMIQKILLPDFPSAIAGLARFLSSTRNATVFTICAGYLERVANGFKFDGKREAVLILALLWYWLVTGRVLMSYIEGGNGRVQPDMRWLLYVIGAYDWYPKFLLMSRPTLLLFHHMGVPNWLHVGLANALSFCMMRFTVLKGSPAWWHKMVPDEVLDKRTALSAILYQYSLFAASAYFVPDLIEKVKSSVRWNAWWVRTLSIVLLFYFPRFNVYPRAASEGINLNFFADGAGPYFCRDCETITGAWTCLSTSSFMDFLWVGNLVLVLQPGCYLLEVVGRWSLGIYCWHINLFRIPVTERGILVCGYKIFLTLPEVLHKVVLFCGKGALSHSMIPVLIMSIVASTLIGVGLISGAMWHFFFGGFLDALKFVHALFFRSKYLVAY